MQIRTKLVVSMFSVLGAFACGDEEGDGGGSGVPQDTAVGELSAEQAQAVCESLQAKAQRAEAVNLKFTCYRLHASKPLDMCEQGMADCLNNNGTAADLDCDDATASRNPKTGCPNVKVGDIEACFEATTKALEDVADKVTCSATLEEVRALVPSDSAPPAACSAVAQACPGFLD